MRHIQTLRIGHTETNRYSRYTNLIDLLEGLPRDTLKLFDFGTSGSLDYRQMQYLWRTQKSLTNLQLSTNVEHQSDLPTLNDIVTEDYETLRALKSVKQLSLKIGEATDSESLSQLLVSLEYTRLEAVDMQCDRDEDYTRVLDYHDFPIFLPRTIQRMSLTCVGLPLESTIELDYWPNLIHMEIRWCDNVAPALANYSWPKLVSFVYTGFQGMRRLEETDAYAINSMLSRFQCLQHLKIDFAWSAIDSRLRYKVVGRMAKAIVRHSARLKSLVYEETSIPDQPDKSTNVITAAAKQCVNLEELAIWGVKPPAMVRICKV